MEATALARRAVVLEKELLLCSVLPQARAQPPALPLCTQGASAQPQATALVQHAAGAQSGLVGVWRAACVKIKDWHKSSYSKQALLSVWGNLRGGKLVLFARAWIHVICTGRMQRKEYERSDLVEQLQEFGAPRPVHA